MVDIIYYTDAELDTINSGCYLLLETQGEEREAHQLNQIIYIQRLIFMYNLYNRGLKLLYNDLYRNNDMNYVSTLTIAVHPNFSGFSFFGNEINDGFKQKFIQYLDLIRTPYQILNTGSIYISYENCAGIPEYEMWKDLGELDGLNILN